MCRRAIGIRIRWGGVFSCVIQETCKELKSGEQELYIMVGNGFG